jgi:hypothetical protein
MRTKSILLSVLVSCVLMLGTLWLLDRQASSSVAQGPDGYDTYHVALSCLGVPTPCYTMTQSAVDAVDNPNDIIKIASGVYTDIHVRAGVTQVVFIDKSLTIQGGYTTTDWAVPHPITQPTKLDAQGQGRAVFVKGQISTTLEGLWITGGNAAGMSQMGIPDPGGGIYAVSALVGLSETRVYSNTAAEGGGIFLMECPAASLSGNDVFSNTASGTGGGVYVASTGADLTGNRVHGNQATAGGGLYIGVSPPVTLTGNIVYSNAATSHGGGISVYSTTVTLSGNQIYSNTAENGNGAGIELYKGHGATLTGNDIYGNTSATQSGGGVSLSYTDGATLRENRMYANSAGRTGGGVSCSDCDNLLLVRNDVFGNIVTGNHPSDHGGGGLHIVYGAGAILEYNRIHHNTANSHCGGMLLSASRNVEMTSNQVFRNTATGEGGGICIFHGPTATLSNNIIVENQLAGGQGAGIYLTNVDADLIHNTIASNWGGDGSGIFVAFRAATPAEVTLTNTILVSHTVGITVSIGSTATLEATLWGSGTWSNSANWGGAGRVTTGPLNIWVEPGFANPPATDYHLGSSSTAIDMGAYTVVVSDIDGETRLGKPDIGADEFIWYIELPLILKDP